jgi:hypothetical protein
MVTPNSHAQPLNISAKMRQLLAARGCPPSGDGPRSTFQQSQDKFTHALADPRAFESFGAMIQSLTALAGQSDRQPAHFGWRSWAILI